MRAKLTLMLLCMALVPALVGTSRAAPGDAIEWQPWSDRQFDQARSQKKFVILDLEAVWCHWCHVMERETYQNPKVVQLIRNRFLPVRVDQDANPDIARRYEDYGWPATIVFNDKGQEIVKRRGYIASDKMATLLQAIIDDPSPVSYPQDAMPTGFSERSTLDVSTRAQLEKRFRDTHDQHLGGPKHIQKYLDANRVEYALWRAALGDGDARRMARQTLEGARRLIDPAWGGMYQYSTHSDWRHPHYEKIMSVQADALRIYALAYQVLGSRPYLDDAHTVLRYLDRFLTSPDGVYYTSQDADLVPGEHADAYFALDDLGRRAQGIPRVDTHLYARENGWVIQALAQLYSASGDAKVLERAVRAAKWITRHRGIEGGGFRHDARDRAGPYLEDSLSMGRAFLLLYSVTADRTWLAQAEGAMVFMREHFASASPAGFVTAVERGVLKAHVQLDENVALARFANSLARYTGNARYRTDAQKAMRLVATPEVALRRMFEAGVLLADAELHNDPAHITVVGRKDDANAQALFAAAMQIGAPYRRLEWWDRREGALPNPDVQYPGFERAAAFICTNQTCSLPIFEKASLADRANRLIGVNAKIAPEH